MSLLLNAHAFHWRLADDPLLGTAARNAILATPRVAVSADGVWELAIRLALGKARLAPMPCAGGRTP